MKRTARGFAIYGEFKDTKGQSVRVQQSSSADTDAVWVFCNDKEGRQAIQHMGELISASPHLNKTQAKRMIRALTKFVDGL